MVKAGKATACLACGSNDLAHWCEARDVECKSVPETFDYYRCAECQALSINPVPFDRLHTIYPANYYSFVSKGASPAYRAKEWLDRRWFRDVTRSVPGAALSALDVGGGAGQQLTTLKAANPRITRTVIVDLEQDAEETARAAGHDYVLGRIEDVTLREQFDVVLLLNLIEHVSDPLAVLKKVRSILSERGVVVVKTPNHESLDARLFRHRNWGGYHCPRHWVIFTRSGFERIARGAGLSVRRCQYTQGAPFWTVSVLAWLDDHRLIRITRERPVWRHPLFEPMAAAFAVFDFARGVVWPLSQMTFTLQRATTGTEV